MQNSKSASEKTIIYISISNLHFDPKNPRFPPTVNGYDDLEVIDWMLQKERVLELMTAIGENDYFPGEPIIAIEAELAGHYYVIEGNRRLCAIRLLSQPNLGYANSKEENILLASKQAKHKPVRLPVIVYPTRDEILNHLGYRHTTGIQKWSHLAKSRHAEQIQTTLGQNNPKRSGSSSGI